MGNYLPNGRIQSGDVFIAKNYLTDSEMRSFELIVSAYLDLAERRAYADYQEVLANLRLDYHKVAGQLIKELGMKAHELSLIKPTQLNDNNHLRYISKGGQLNVREISPDLADKLRGYFTKDGEFRIDKQELRADLKLASKATGQEYNGIHGLRWSVAQKLMQNLLHDGKLYEECLATVSEFLTHHRTYITEHYLKR